MKGMVSLVMENLITYLPDLMYDEHQFSHLTYKQFSYFSTEPYVVVAQKNGLNEMVLLSTQNKCLN